MSFRVPRIKSCFFCIPLEFGVWIIVCATLLFCSAMLLIPIAFQLHMTSNVDLIDIVDGTLNELLFIAYTIFSISLLIGIRTKNPNYVFPWILLQLGAIIFSSLSFVHTIILNTLRFYVGTVSSEMGFLVVNCYMMLVVYNYYRELKAPSFVDVFDV